MLHRLRARGLADRAGDIRARCPVVSQHADLDELVGAQRRVDLADDLGRKACIADHHDRVQVMGLRPQRAPLG